MLGGIHRLPIIGVTMKSWDARNVFCPGKSQNVFNTKVGNKAVLPC
jgi:hypothetical protein